LNRQGAKFAKGRGEREEEERGKKRRDNTNIILNLKFSFELSLFPSSFFLGELGALAVPFFNSPRWMHPLDNRPARVRLWTVALDRPTC
jgi:hypothetical protein